VDVIALTVARTSAEVVKRAVAYVATGRRGIPRRAVAHKSATVVAGTRAAGAAGIANSRARLPRRLRGPNALPIFGVSASPLAW
jgi:hypothetical protein